MFVQIQNLCNNLELWLTADMESVCTITINN